jgi:hypothetical protein
MEKRRERSFSRFKGMIMSNVPQMLWFKPGLLGAVIGAFALTVVGFSQLGWVTANTAELMALRSSDAAVVKALVPVCVTRAQIDPETGSKLQALGGVTSNLARSSFVEKAGWAKMPGEETSNSLLANACAAALGQLAGT